jgi:hypothetical protein
MPAPSEKPMDIPADTIKAIYRRAIDPRASDSESAAWWDAVAITEPKWATPVLDSHGRHSTTPIRPTPACPDHSGAVGTGAFPYPPEASPRRMLPALSI